MSAERLLELARGQGVMIATAESCTGGLIAGAITEIPGSSDVFDRGFVTYSNGAKTEMLRVRSDVISAHGAVSEPVAAAMAEGAVALSQADLAVSVTGVAGPGGSEQKPEGMVCFGLARSGQPTTTETRQFGPLGRKRVREETVRHAINLLIQHLSKND